MKRYILIITIGFFAATLQAQQNQPAYSRSFTRLGGAFTVGETFAADNLGYGLSTMTYKFFEPFSPGGFYFGLGGTNIRHTVGGVLIGDVQPATIGWRREAAGPFGVDISFSPVIGSRIIGNTIFGNLYFGVKPMAGAFFVFNDSIDVELVYEPVFHIFNLSGSDVRNKTYHDFSLYVVLKNFSLTNDLGWNSTAP